MTLAPVRPAVPVGRHSLLFGRRALALVTPDMAVSPLAGSGHFSAQPQREQLPLGQRYALGTMTVRARWTVLRMTAVWSHV
jgi:hypothetical protein